MSIKILGEKGSPKFHSDEEGTSKQIIFFTFCLVVGLGRRIQEVYRLRRMSS